MFETMEHHDEYLGKRIKRGLFKSSTGKLINADINGAIGIMRKAKEISDDQIKILRDRGDIVSPKVLNI
jgi:putative transposase